MSAAQPEGRPSPYKERDYAFGRVIFTLRTKIGLTQAGLAAQIGVSRRVVGSWEIGAYHMKPEHLKAFIALAMQHRAFSQGNEVEEIRALWTASRTKMLLDEQWLSALLAEDAPRIFIVRSELLREDVAALSDSTAWDDCAWMERSAPSRHARRFYE